MTAVIDMVALFLAFILFALSAFLLAEVVAAFIARPERPPPQVQKRARIGVVIPAHNERDAVAATVKAVRAELRDVDRLIVVADNCSDDTAALAGPAGADAIERNDASRCGKGYALQFGVDHLRGDPPDVVVFIDADCRPAPGAIEKIAARAAYIQRPVQALYLMNVPDGAKPKASVSAFAWLVMNRVRMSGLQKIAGVTRLTGSGMALPWRLVSDIDIASGEIVEDIALTAKFVEAGYPPFLDLDALVTSRLAASDKGAATQRARWELGSIHMAARKAPGLFVRGLGGDIKSLALAIDLAIPPLAVFACYIVAAIAISGLAALLGAHAAISFAVWSAILYAVAIAIAWTKFGRDVLPPSRLKAVAAYIGEKARVYGREGRKSAKTWTRTDRADAERDANQ
ncbi:MAG: glycosyltransferase family 2 protein [Parvularculaceae bacterium]|nr:glycosyltransferase family 2 protein [Parvularculaceae bacterium]